MIYLLLAIIALLLLAAAYLAQPVKGGKLLDAVLTEKTRWQVWWDEYKAWVCFVAGLLLGLIAGAGL